MSILNILQSSSGINHASEKKDVSTVTVITTTRGSKQAIDANGFKYFLNGPRTGKVAYWRCTKKDCTGRLISRLSTSKLVGESLPQHDHSTNILKSMAKQEEKNIIKKHASLPMTNNKMMMSEISKNLLSSSHPNTHFSMSTTAALKMALYREKKKLNPLPPLPKTFQDVMNTVIPSSLTNTADGTEFMILNSWINDLEEEAMMIFMSDVGADVMRRAPIWMMDGTFFSAPTPYYQVK